MAPLPKRRHSSRRQAKRSRALSQKAQVLIVCKQCGKDSLPHRVCKYCGFYNKKAIIIKKEKNKADKK
jgi:large subunit ribosomal protein L32